jgi:hypothetical protein
MLYVLNAVIGELTSSCRSKRGILWGQHRMALSGQQPRPDNGPEYNGYRTTARLQYNGPALERLRGTTAPCRTTALQYNGLVGRCIMGPLSHVFNADVLFLGAVVQKRPLYCLGRCR